MRRVNSQEHGRNDQATLVVTVDLEPGSVHTTLEQARRLDETTDWLIKTFGRLGLSATWAVADPAHSAATERLMAAELGHELAVLGDSSWAGREAGRGRFAHELARRVLGSRAAGIPVTSLVPRDVEIGDHLDLLVKHDMTAVRGPIHSTGRRLTGRQRTPAQPRTLHFGLWEIPGSVRLPDHGAWLAGLGLAGVMARRSIRRCAHQRHVFHLPVFHLVVDAWRLAAGRERDRRVLERTLSVARQAQEQHALRLSTLAEVAARLSHVPRVDPARSILRPAG